MFFWFIEELPRISTVESSDSNAFDEGGIEVAQMYPVPGARHRIHGLPMRDTAAGPAADGSQGPVALNVFVRGVGMAVNPDGSELEIDPRPTDPAAQRAVAGGGDFRRGWERQSDCAAMT